MAYRCSELVGNARFGWREEGREGRGAEGVGTSKEVCGGEGEGLVGVGGERGEGADV